MIKNELAILYNTLYLNGFVKDNNGTSSTLIKNAIEIIDTLQTENEELSKSNFHFLEINQKLIEEKPIIKELTEKELNLLEKIDKLQKDSISKDIIRNFIKEELPDDEIMKSCEMFDMNGVYLRKKLEELLGE